MENNVESGRATSEWVITLIVMGCGFMTAVLGGIFPTDIPEWARITLVISGALMTTLQGSSYVIGRSIRKIGQ